MKGNAWHEKKINSKRKDHPHAFVCSEELTVVEVRIVLLADDMGDIAVEKL